MRTTIAIVTLLLAVAVGLAMRDADARRWTAQILNHASRTLCPPPPAGPQPDLHAELRGLAAARDGLAARDRDLAALLDQITQAPPDALASRLMELDARTQAGADDVVRRLLLSQDLAQAAFPDEPIAGRIDRTIARAKTDTLTRIVAALVQSRSRANAAEHQTQELCRALSDAEGRIASLSAAADRDLVRCREQDAAVQQLRDRATRAELAAQDARLQAQVLQDQSRKAEARATAAEARARAAEQRVPREPAPPPIFSAAPAAQPATRPVSLPRPNYTPAPVRVYRPRRRPQTSGRTAASVRPPRPTSRPCVSGPSVTWRGCGHGTAGRPRESNPARTVMLQNLCYLATDQSVQTRWNATRSLPCPSGAMDKDPTARPTPNWRGGWPPATSRRGSCSMICTSKCCSAWRGSSWAMSKRRVTWSRTATYG